MSDRAPASPHSLHSACTSKATLAPPPCCCALERLGVDCVWDLGFRVGGFGVWSSTGCCALERLGGRLRVFWWMDVEFANLWRVVSGGGL